MWPAELYTQKFCVSAFLSLAQPPGTHCVGGWGAQNTQTNTFVQHSHSVVTQISPEGLQSIQILFHMSRNAFPDLWETLARQTKRFKLEPRTELLLYN